MGKLIIDPSWKQAVASIKKKFFDLTRGKYPTLYPPQGGTREYNDEHESCFVEVFSKTFKYCSFLRGGLTSEILMNNVPIFLVESSMANEYVAVPGCQYSVRVPEDRGAKTIVTSSFDIDRWLHDKEKELSGKKVDDVVDKRVGLSIFDYLGVYVFTSNDDVMPFRIFIWMDKILDYAKKNSDENESSYNAQALFDFVVYHEIGHALMDVEHYGLSPSPHFSYANDYVYRFFEEAYADAFALFVLNSVDHESGIDKYQLQFVEEFVEQHSVEFYHYGNNYGPYRPFSQWMSVKVQFNYDIAVLLREAFRNNLFIDCVKTVEIYGAWAFKNISGKWGLVDIKGNAVIPCQYDSIESFNDQKVARVEKDGEVFNIDAKGNRVD